MSAFIVSTDTIDLIVSALARIQGPELSSPLGLQTIGADLWAENHRSVNFRYDEKTPTPAYTFEPVDLDMIKDWQAVALKSLRCWQYQSCETNDFKDTTAYRVAQALMGLLVASDKSEAYNAAPWGWVRTIEEPTPEPEPERPRLSTTEHAAEIRKELKTKHGWTSRQVSVRAEYFSMGSAIRVTIKDANVIPSIVEAVANRAEDISRCSYTGEILSGGNRYVTISYDQDVLAQLGARWAGAVDAAYLGLLAASDNSLIEIAGTPYLLGYDNTRHGFSLWRDSHQGNYYDLGSVAQGLGRKMANEMAAPAVEGVH